MYYLKYPICNKILHGMYKIKYTPKKEIKWSTETGCETVQMLDLSKKKVFPIAIIIMSIDLRETKIKELKESDISKIRE